MNKIIAPLILGLMLCLAACGDDATQASSQLNLNDFNNPKGRVLKPCQVDSDCGSSNANCFQGFCQN